VGMKLKFDPELIKRDFPILSREINGKQIVYLDSGATSQKPQVVLDAISQYYMTSNAAAHRGAHQLGDEATQMLMEARRAVTRFLGAGSEKEIVFLRNTTEAINLVAYSWGMSNIGKGDKIVVTEMEHHANIVPWQQLAERVEASVEYVGVTSEGKIDIDDYKQKVKGAKLVSFVQVSNALGTVNPAREMVKIAKKSGATVMVDGAQAVPHLKVDVSSLGCDFYAFSGHKMLGPGGAGVLWGKREILEKMKPFLTGGGMISEVHKDGSSWAALPDKFEAGVPDVASYWGLKVAIEYLEKLGLPAQAGMESVREHDMEIVGYALDKLNKVTNLVILGPQDPEIRSGSVSFTYNGVHAHDVATILSENNVMVRSGHHCTMILHEKMGVAASVRASFNVYTTKSDIDSLVEALGQVKKTFGK